MEALRAATNEEHDVMPNYICTFHRWMERTFKLRAEKTARSHARMLGILFQEDGKAPEVMATEEYLSLTKASIKNKNSNGQRSASVKAFIDFMAAHEGPLEEAQPDSLYQAWVKAPTRKRKRPADEGKHVDGEEEKRLREQ
eukprot:TRINITY_DN6242_c0_g2_i1.p1 TRINITY_DN6242_c0_g2~~TRINITY_DN6242_c0_g2_i1.p1  ORF type:complete len:141 (+),score=24.29 TRINITY_DN6242_c0_g2_i1:52-474(+)